MRGICATFCFVLFCFNFISLFFCLLQVLQACRSEPVLIAGTGRCYRSTAVYTAVLQYLYHQYYYYAVQHVSQAPPGRAKCPADPHARRRPKREAEGREPAAAGHGDRGAILAGAAVSPPGPQRIIAQMLRACGIQVQVIKYSNNI